MAPVGYQDDHFSDMGVRHGCHVGREASTDQLQRTYEHIFPLALQTAERVVGLKRHAWLSRAVALSVDQEEAA